GRARGPAHQHRRRPRSAFTSRQSQAGDARGWEQPAAMILLFFFTLATEQKIYDLAVDKKAMSVLFAPKSTPAAAATVGDGRVIVDRLFGPVTISFEKSRNGLPVKVSTVALGGPNFEPTVIFWL